MNHNVFRYIRSLDSIEAIEDVLLDSSSDNFDRTDVLSLVLHTFVKF